MNSMQAGLRVAYQGEPGAFSEDAVRQFLGAEALPVPHFTLSAVIEAVVAGTVHAGVLPLENSTAGPVEGVAALLQRPGLDVLADTWLPVRHCLLCLPGQTLANLRQVMSHPQAFAQCADFLRTLHVELLPAADTAGSARLIWERGWSGVAAIANRRAAQVYGLTVLYENIQTRSDNRTHFLLLAAQLPLRDASRHPLRSSAQRVVPGGPLCR